MTDEPFKPDLTDAKWYLPITSIVKAVATVWRLITGTNYKTKRRK